MFKDQTVAGSSIGGNAQTAPAREGEIVEGLRSLSAAIDSMEGAAANLSQRLFPVLRPSVPSDSVSNAATAYYTPFGQELARLRERIWLITSIVDDASGRLELP